MVFELPITYMLLLPIRIMDGLDMWLITIYSLYTYFHTRLGFLAGVMMEMALWKNDVDLSLKWEMERFESVESFLLNILYNY